jgi:hypothetical protein
MTESTTPEPGDPSRLLDSLVAQTLDDLDEGRFDLETALHALARAACRVGYRYGPPPADNQQRQSE